MLKKSGRKFLSVLMALTMVLSILPMPPAKAASSSITFADTDGNTGSANVVKVLSNGKYLTAGSICDSSTYTIFGITVVRYNSNGTIDTTFGTNGRTVISTGTGDNSAIGIVVQQDGKIVVAAGVKGTSSLGYDFTMFRLTANGILDNSFGGSGITKTNLGKNSDNSNTTDTVRAMVSDNFDNIYLIGDFQENDGAGTYQNFAVAKYTSGGLLDSSYGTNGIVRLDFDGSATGYHYGTAAALDANGKLVIGGILGSGTTYYAVFTRLNTDGSLDTTFGVEGKLMTTAIGSNATILVMALQPVTNTIIAAGYYSDTAISPFVVSLTDTGAISNTYKTRISDVFSASDIISGMAFDLSGNIYLVCTAMNSSSQSTYGVVKIKSDLSALDTSFNSTGKVLQSVGTLSDDAANGIAVDSNGKIAVVGYIDRDGTIYDEAFIRLNADGTLDSLGNAVPVPTVAEINVTSGPTIGGTGVTITGANFTCGVTDVKFGETSAAYTIDSATQITAISPIHLAGTVDITVTAEGGISTTGTADQFTYISPDLTAPMLIAVDASRTSDTEGTVRFTSNEAGNYYYAVVTDGAFEPVIDTNGAGSPCTTGETTINNPVGLTAGAKDIYIKVKDAAGNLSNVIKIDIAAYVAALSSDAGLTSVLSQAITAGSEAGTSGAPKTASISVANGVSTVIPSDIVKHDSGATVIFYGTDSSFTAPAVGSVSLTAGGATNVYIKIVAADSTTLYYKVDISRAATSNVGSGGSTTFTTTAQPTDTGVEIQINGKTETAATVTTTKVGDQTVTTVIVDDKKVEEKLKVEGNNATVTIPVKNDVDTVVGQLNGQTVKNMENKEAVLEIKTENVTYTLPASQINIDNVSEQIGKQVELKDIKVNVTISAPTQDTVKIVENTANKNNYQVVVKPVEFEITCTSGNKTVEVSKFNGYVERMVAIPDGIDPSKITTGIVLNSDGTFSHVPTVITSINGKYYAKISSLTNSTYSVIWSPKTFKDVEKHWAKDAVTDMGSRLVISGVGNDMFEPDRVISRAEFASIIVRALGLMHPGTGKAVFADVSKSDWYYDAVSIAYENDIISGYGNGNFGPMDKITREQAMTMVSRAMKITGLKVDLTKADTEKILSSFTDGANAADYARTNIAACINAGIVSGRDGKAIAPQDNITRAEVAAIVQRLLQKSKLI